MNSVEFLVKLRDAAQMIADACNEQLEKLAPPEAKYSEIFQGLQAIIKEHKGFCHIASHKYWFDNKNPDVIDRRRKK